MIETKLNPLGGLYRLLGKTKDTTIEIGADATVRVTAGKTTMVIPIQLALALQTEQAKKFLSDPVIASYLVAQNDRETRLWAAQELLRKAVQDQRRDWVVRAVENGLLDEQTAWILARLKFKYSP